MRLALLFLASVLLLSAVGSSEPIIPAMDLTVYGSDGEIISLWGEHNWYHDTLSFGHVLTYHNGTFVVGGNNAN